MEGTQEAVSTLSGTAFGAIIVLMAVGFSAAFVMMARYIRQLTKSLMDVAALRVEDANRWGDQSRGLLRESMDMINKASVALEDHRKKICALEEGCSDRIKNFEKEVQDLKKEVKDSLNCRECPARAKALGG